MPERTFDVATYNSVIQSELYKLIGIGGLLGIVLIACIAYCVWEIKENRTKKSPYIALVCMVLIAVFLLVSFSVTVVSHAKDLKEESYVQYEGPINISMERKTIYGGIPTFYYEYVIRFANNGEQVELTTRENYGLSGSIENRYIVYAEHTGMILVFEE